MTELQSSPKSVSRKVYILIAVLFSALILSYQSPAMAAKISSVKGRTVLIKLGKSKAKKGDTFNIYDKKRRKSGIVKITSVKGTSARGRLLPKSSAKAGYRLKLRRRAGKKYSKRKRSKKKKKKWSKDPGGDMYWGLIGGFGSNTMAVTLRNDEKVNLSGSGFSLKGLIDYKLFSSIWFRGLVGYEGFNTSGKDNDGCGDNESLAEPCQVNIGYLSVDLWGRWIIMSGTFRPWVGAGFDLMVPMTNDTTALDESSITSTSVFAGGAGFDWFMSDTMFIPVQIETGVYPASENVSASYFALRAGAAWQW